MDRLLTPKDVSNIVGFPINVLLYDDFKNFDNIEDAFIEHKNGCIPIKRNGCLMLYRFGENFGHWCSLSKDRNGNLTFFDPYGQFIDDCLDYTPINYKGYLSKLLYKYVCKGGKVEYNNDKLQKLSNNIATCGRWCGFYLRFHNIPIDIFGDIFDEYKKKGYNLDEIIVKLTDKYISRERP